MKRSSKVFLLVIFTLSVIYMQAQEAVTTAGGNVANSSGAVSYTIGQPFVSVSNANGYTLSEGVQQAFEIMEVGIAEEAKVLDVEVIVFPNPTEKEVNIQANGNDKEMQYQLYNVEGKVITAGSWCGEQYSISLQALAKGVYMLRLGDKERGERLFKIVKK